MAAGDCPSSAGGVEVSDLSKRDPISSIADPVLRAAATAVRLYAETHPRPTQVTQQQAAAFKAWVDTCGIDWTTGPRDGPIPDFVKPPERPDTIAPTPASRATPR